MLLLRAIERVEMEGFELGDDSVGQPWKDLLQRKGERLGVGEHVRRQGFPLALAGLEDHHQLSVAAGIPLGTKAAFVIVAEGDGIFKLDD